MQSDLSVRLRRQWQRIALFSAHQHNLITGIRQRCADANHALIVVQIVGDGEVDGFHKWKVRTLIDFGSAHKNDESMQHFWLLRLRQAIRVNRFLSC